MIAAAARCGGPDAIRRILTLLTTMFCRLLMAILICCPQIANARTMDFIATGDSPDPEELAHELYLRGKER